ncbi:MAG: acyl-CoA dehydrogenase family protein [SAR324 cluster bacterium]|nr:acyl-CoA dehydrogenase family protein [SAR324 cluster bacterium]
MGTQKGIHENLIKRDKALQSARDMIPLLKERAAETETLGRIHQDTIEDMHRNGLWRMCQPARLNGGELDYGTLLETTIELGRGCGSTAWVFINVACHHWMLAMWPAAAQDEIWGKDPNTFIASSLIYPAGKAVPVEGGYRLSGRWPFCSGIDVCDWSMLGAMLVASSEHRDQNATADVPQPHMIIVPKSSLEILETWQVVGLIATGSKDVRCDNVFIPGEMALSVHEVKGGPTPGSLVNPSPHYKLPVAGLFSHLIAAPIIGMATGVYDMCLESFRSRVSTYNKSKLSDHTTTHLRIAEAGVLLQSARLLLRSNCEEATQMAEADQIPSTEDKVRWRRDASHAATVAAQAANQLNRSVGGSAIYNSNPLQRHIRDMNVGLSHIGVSWDVNGTEFGRVALGLEPNNPNV